MSFLPTDKATNADVSFHYFSGKDNSSYYKFSYLTYLGAGVTRPTINSFVLSSGRSYWLRGAVSFTRGSNNYALLELHNQWELEGSLAGFKSVIVSCSSYAQRILRKNPTNRVESVLFIPSSAITTSVTVKLKQTYINSDNGNTTLTYAMDSATPCGCIIMSVPD